jgi:DNA (cytosine-5)-methyltransferase 1
MRSVSLFSGCGGLDLGLERAGFHTVFASDLDEDCGESFRRNFPDVPFHVGNAADLTRELMDEVSRGATRSQVDLLAGGPPCPPFSKSRFYRKEKKRALEDEVGEETISAYLNTLCALRPRAFLLENVAGLAYKVHKSALKLIIDTAQAEGYEIASKVINAADYGVPQLRERFFVVGTLDRPLVFPEPAYAKDPSADLLSQRRAPWRTAGDVLADLDTEENADDTGHFAGGKYHAVLRQIPPGDNYLYFTAHRGHPDPQFVWRSRYWSFLLKLSPDMPSWTIQARRSNNMGPFHWRNRILRIEEVKRLQTFPDDWYLSGKVEKQWRQIGNAVPPMLAEALGVAIREHLAAADADLPQAA